MVDTYGGNFPASGALLVKGGAPWFDVKAFGATGNGTTDDTVMIQAAITAIGSTGGVVFFPQGIYKVSSTLTMTDKNGITFRGVNKEASQILCSGSGNLFNISGTTEILRYTFEDIQLDGNSVASIAINLTNAKDFSIENCIIARFLNHGISFSGGNTLHNTIRACRIAAAGTRLGTARAINFSAGSTLSLLSNYFLAYDVLIDSVGDTLFSAGNIYESSTNAIKTGGSSFVSIGDYFTAFTKAYQITANNSTTIITPRGVVRGDIDDSAVSNKGFLQILMENAQMDLGGARIQSGTGSPENVVTAPVGSLYLRTDSATSFYVKQTGAGNTGWIAK